MNKRERMNMPQGGETIIQKMRRIAPEFGNAGVRGVYLNPQDRPRFLEEYATWLSLGIPAAKLYGENPMEVAKGNVRYLSGYAGVDMLKEWASLTEKTPKDKTWQPTPELIEHVRTTWLSEYPLE